MWCNINLWTLSWKWMWLHHSVILVLTGNNFISKQLDAIAAENWSKAVVSKAHASLHTVSLLTWGLNIKIAASHNPNLLVVFWKTTELMYLYLFVQQMNLTVCLATSGKCYSPLMLLWSLRFFSRIQGSVEAVVNVSIRKESLVDCCPWCSRQHGGGKECTYWYPYFYSFFWLENMSHN